ncbi:MAG: hypothetical protein JNG88_05110 [Phycisphaerales bacterium]|nr:hypothetical protein [Phycisphaerales bacterium]
MFRKSLASQVVLFALLIGLQTANLVSAAEGPAADDADAHFVAQYVGPFGAQPGVPLAQGAIIRIEGHPRTSAALQLEIPMQDQTNLRLSLRPNSVRDAGYQLREQVADGTWRVLDSGPERTFTGEVEGDPGSWVAGSWLSEGMFARVAFSDGASVWIQPLAEFIPGADGALHVVYRAEDTLCQGDCGTQSEAESGGSAGDGGPAGTCGGSVCVAQIACDADVEYYNARGNSTHNTQDRIHAIINVMNHQYVREVQITHVITTVLVRTAEPDPYSSNVSDTLMCQFITEWTDNQTAITRDLAKLFTGRDISGSTVGQAANTGQICDNNGFCTAGLDNGAYCYSQSDFSSNFACQTDVAAHQIGHLWGAFDCNCPNSTMNSTISCANTFANSGGVSVAEIDAHADQVLCLTALNNPPANDTCDDAVILPGSGTYAGSNVNSSTDGGALNCGILSGDVGGGRSDVYWRITASANGTASIDTCGSNFDTMLSIHSGCPATPANQIVCNDDCGGDCDLDSCLAFSVTSGTSYYIRVSGYGGATGSITLNVNGPFTPGNNSCANARAVEDGTATDGSLALATNDGSANCGTSATNPDVWYTFTAGPCGGSLLVDTCGTHDRQGQDTGMDTVLSIHSGCPGTSGNQLVCVDDASPACPGDAGLIRDSRATVTLTPNQTVLIRVSHFSTAIDDGFFFLHVDFTDAVLAPAITGIGNASLDCGDAYTGPTPALTNPGCMSPVTWSLVTGPSGMTINSSSGVVTWPTPTTAGSPHMITIRATNSTGFDDESWFLTVNRLPPVIVPIGNESHTCGGAYTGPTPVLANGSCMIPATWSLVTGPSGMTINTSTGVVSWPTPTTAGSPHTITIRATNSAGFDDESWQLTVDLANPVVNDIPNGSATCGSAYTSPTPTLTNPTCMNPVVWSLRSGPSGMTINAATGVVSWPTPTPAGSMHTIVIRATNSAGFDDEGWRIAVENALPIVNDVPNGIHDCGLPYTGPTPSVTNSACMNPINWSLVTAPAGMTIDSATGIVTWPAPTAAGSPHTITIRATNSAGFDDETWILRVSIIAPVIVDIPNATIPEGSPYTGPTPAIIDPDCMLALTWSLVTGPTGMVINPGTGVLSWPGPISAGSPHAVTIRATNAVGFDDESWMLTVTSTGCPTTCGDMNCDGLVNNFDINPFVMALSDPVLYEASFPDCNLMNGDIDENGLLNNFDINPFVECISLGGCP